MAAIAVIAAIIGGIAVWWWRVQQVKGAASTVIDAAGKARGMISRASFKRRAGASVLSGVDSPGMAAATLLYSIMALKQPLSLSDEARIDGLLDTVCRMAKQEREDAIAFAAWASGQVADTIEIVRRFTPLWAGALDMPQRKELVDMTLQVAESGGPPNDAQSAVIRRLSEGLLAR